MPQITDSLSPHAVIGLDTMVFVYYLEDSTSYGDIAEQVLEAVESGTIRGVTAETTVMELLVQPLRIGRPDIAAEYETFLTNFPNLTMAPITRDTIRQAASLRASDGLHAMDALQIATCAANGATAFVTNDLRLRRRTSLDVVLLDDFL